MLGMLTNTVNLAEGTEDAGDEMVAEDSGEEVWLGHC